MLENFELEYWQLLIAAIEKYTVRNISNNRYCYYYDNIDFTYAVQKRLYFDILSQDKYSVDIKKCLSSSFSSIIYVKNETHKNILEIMYKDCSFIFCVSKNIKEFSKSIILQNRLLINGAFKFLKKNYLSDTTQYSSAFLIIHHKFIYFFDEINKKLDNTLFIIISDVNKSIQLCKKKNIKYIVLQKNAYLLKQPSLDTVELSIQYEMLQNLVKNYKINNLILPEGNSPIYEVFNLVAIKLKIKTICIQHGWSTIIHNGFRNMHYSIFLSWGEIYSDILQKYNPKQKFKSVGNHVLNVEYSNKRKDCISFFLQTVTPLITKEIFDSFIDFIIHISDNYPAQQLIIREHPGAPLAKEVKDKLNMMNNIKFMNYDKYLLSEVLNISKVAVSIYSSTLYESLLYDTIPFIYNLTSLNHLTPNLSKLKVGIEVNTYNEAIKEMNNLLATNEYKDIYNNIKIKKMLYFETTGKYAVDNIIKEINAL